MKTLYADTVLAVLLWLFKDYLLTKARMRARIKFIGDFRHHYGRCRSLKAAFFLARNTL